MSAVCIFPFHSIIPEQLKIFGWYLVGGCIRGQRCVPRMICVDATFDLDPVTLKPKFPSALYLLSEWLFLVDIWCEDVSGDRCVVQKIIVDATFDLDSKLHNISFRSIIPKWLTIFGWYLVGECIKGQRCVARKNRVDANFDLVPVTLKPKFPSALWAYFTMKYWLSEFN
jgi:hypothetical protein